MKVLLNNNDLIDVIKNIKNIGFVPTMGSLHKGHESLIKESQKKTKNTVVSIFVNPKQFNDKKDFARYPQNQKKDLAILKKLNVDYVFIPSVENIYPKKSKNKNFSIDKNLNILCAKYRKGHFEGVLEVMDRLTYLIKPNKIFMGEKDFQQFYLVKKLLEKKYSTKVFMCKTIRNSKGLALSSRNKLLSKKQINIAEKIITSLKLLKIKLKKLDQIEKKIMDEKKILEKKFNCKIQYLELRNKKNFKKTNKLKNSKLFVAFFLKKVRLIDNF